jgi:hypothetical protein
MAIGSAPEIGARFKTGVWTVEEARAWRNEVGPDLLGGYGKLAYPDRSKFKMFDAEFPLIPYVDTPAAEN